MTQPNNTAGDAKWRKAIGTELASREATYALMEAKVEETRKLALEARREFEEWKNEVLADYWNAFPIDSVVVNELGAKYRIYTRSFSLDSPPNYRGHAINHRGNDVGSAVPIRGELKLLDVEAPRMEG